MEQQFALLKDFVALCKKDPSILHHPNLGFYRDFIESLGGTIPPLPTRQPKKETPVPESTPDEKMDEGSIVDDEIEMPVLDESGVIPADEGEELPQGENKEISDDDMEKSSKEREEGQSALSNGDAETALFHFTNAILANPQSAALFAKRAQCLLRLNRPVAAIRDCNKAIELNSDSAVAYKFRGRAHRLLGHWVEAHTDLAVACKLDYDDTANEWLKEVETNAKKMKEYQRAVDRRKEEKELAERRERVKRAKEERERRQAGEEERGGGEGGLGGIGELFGQMMNDPEMKENMQDPEVLNAVMEIMKNPANLMKYMGNEKVMKTFGKMKGMFGGMEGEEEGGCCGEGMGQCPQSSAHSHPPSGSAPPSSSSAPSAAPMPDLD